MTTIIIEGLDRLGKSTLIQGIKNKLGYHLQFHRQKPEFLECLRDSASEYMEDCSDAEIKKEALFRYQLDCFRQDMNLITHSQYLGPQSNEKFNIIFDRSWIGEAVYSHMYRGYNGDYVFELEEDFNLHNTNSILILLTEDFAHSRHFVDDGESFDISKREHEQTLFIEAFHKSIVPHKLMINVTDVKSGGFRDKNEILQTVLDAVEKIESR